MVSNRLNVDPDHLFMKSFNTGDIRNDVFITLERGEFEKGKVCIVSVKSATVMQH